ncbi:hypothetical protein CsSME_00050667 [Camellia sinensis var. sinensis]
MDMDEKGQGRTRECGQMKRIENWFMLFLTWSIQEITRLTMISSQAFLGCLKECCMRSCRGVELRLSHTESRVKTLKRDTGTVFDMVNGVGCSGFGWDFNTNMVVAEKQVWDGYVQVLYYLEFSSFLSSYLWCLPLISLVILSLSLIINVFLSIHVKSTFALIVKLMLKLLATSVLLPGKIGVSHIVTCCASSSREIVLWENMRNKGKKRKNSSDRLDAFREAVMIIGTKIEEATDKFSRALGVDLDIALKRDKINEELCKLSNP